MFSIKKIISQFRKELDIAKEGKSTQNDLEKFLTDLGFGEPNTIDNRGLYRPGMDMTLMFDTADTEFKNSAWITMYKPIHKVIEVSKDDLRADSRNGYTNLKELITELLNTANMYIE